MKIKKIIISCIAALLLMILVAGASLQYFNSIKNEAFVNAEENVIKVDETEKEKQEENNNTLEIQDEKTNETYIVEIPEEIKQEETHIVEEPPVQNTNEMSQDYAGGFNGYLTHYGPDCAGCGGITASGYDVRNTIYYNDSQYGQLRIVALSRDYPLYTVIRMNNYKGGEIYAIVLDRGGAITGDRIDLLVSSEAEASNLGVQSSVSVDIIRWGK